MLESVFVEDRLGFTVCTLYIGIFDVTGKRNLLSPFLDFLGPLCW